MGPLDSLVVVVVSVGMCVSRGLESTFEPSADHAIGAGYAADEVVEVDMLVDTRENCDQTRPDEHSEQNPQRHRAPHRRQDHNELGCLVRGRGDARACSAMAQANTQAKEQPVDVVRCSTVRARDLHTRARSVPLDQDVFDSAGRDVLAQLIGYELYVGSQ